MVKLSKRAARLSAMLMLVSLLPLPFLSGCGAGQDQLIDDWSYHPEASQDGRSTPIPVPAPTPTPAALSPSPGPSQIGLATGGAKDINSFRENVKNDYLPLLTDITYEGLFYGYYFDTGEQEECRQLFCPSYSYAVTRDPFSGEAEYYLSVGLNSGIKEGDFHRKKLNLVIVLDISGSMSSPFDSYYYDQFGNRVELEVTGEDLEKTKIEIAAESVVALLDHLGDDDRLGMVLFNDSAFLAKPLNLVGETDMRAIKDHILEISADGGTRLSAGMEMATELLGEFRGSNQSEYENRIIFLTDAMPNLGETSEEGLLGMTQDNADGNIYTTLIGIGVDFNTELTEIITKIRGANYYSVHSAKQFRERMDEEFEYMVTPLVFNLQLELEADGWKIEKVYGSPEANEATGELMRVNTLFPSKKEAGETKGGLVLLKLKKTAPENSLRLKVSYEDRNGKSDGTEDSIVLDERPPEFFDNQGIRKGILLSRYADLLQDWLIDEREHTHLSTPWQPRVDSEAGIVVPPPIVPSLGQWERQSIPLAVSEPYGELFQEFAGYFEKEMTAIGDETLSQELSILNHLSNYGSR
jgi:Ca-activated chloride channel family protein